MSKDFDINSNNCTLCKDKLVARWEMVPSSDCQLRSSVDEFIGVSVDGVIEAQRSQPKESFKKWLNEKIKEVETSQNDLIRKIQAGGINTHFKPANEAYWMNARALERYYEELENLETLDTAEDTAGTITKNRKPHYSIDKDPENKPTANPSNIAVTATDTKGQQPVVYNLDIFIANSQLTKQNTNKARLAFEAMKKNGYYETSDDGVCLWKTTKAELSYFASVMIKKFKFPKRKSWVLFEKLFNHEKLCQAHSEISNIYAKNYSRIDTIISESQQI